MGLFWSVIQNILKITPLNKNEPEPVDKRIVRDKESVERDEREISEYMERVRNENGKP